MQGRLQAARLYHLTVDKGVRDLASFLIHAEGQEDLPVPSNFPQKLEHREVSYQYLNFSDGKLAAAGSWAKGRTPDGNGEFSYPVPRFSQLWPDPKRLW